jgi:hypothetical protein
VLGGVTKVFGEGADAFHDVDVVVLGKASDAFQLVQQELVTFWTVNHI